jgi:glutaredoxin 3
MFTIVVYSGPNCPYCERAKALLRKKGAQFQEINVRADLEKLAEMKAKSGGRQTIPQIFINDKHIGGCDDLVALNDRGELDPLLAT